MGRITARWPVHRIGLGEPARRRVDTLAVEEPLEIRIEGRPLVVSMRTPGHDVELAAGFLYAEGIIRAADELRRAIHCGGAGTGGSENTYNVLDVSLAPTAAVPSLEGPTRQFPATSSCGVCGKSSIEDVLGISAHDLRRDTTTIEVGLLLELPDLLRAGQSVFDKTGGLHAAALFDAENGELLVLREDVGRHNAVDKVLGRALLAGRLPASGTVLQVSGRVSFELVQKAAMAGVPVLSAVSAPSSLAVELADSAGLTLVGFVRRESMNVYTHAERVTGASASFTREKEGVGSVRGD
ncbi:formate dehydrogenase accessory sulfurtransferase FdhD [Salana multivorans]